VLFLIVGSDRRSRSRSSCRYCLRDRARERRGVVGRVPERIAHVDRKIQLAAEQPILLRAGADGGIGFVERLVQVSPATPLNPVAEALLFVILYRFVRLRDESWNVA
jgi:hypothetical protein